MGSNQRLSVSVHHCFILRSDISQTVIEGLSFSIYQYQQSTTVEIYSSSYKHHLWFMAKQVYKQLIKRVISHDLECLLYHNVKGNCQETVKPFQPQSCFPGTVFHLRLNPASKQNRAKTWPKVRSDREVQLLLASEEIIWLPFIEIGNKRERKGRSSIENMKKSLRDRCRDKETDD